jgi:hypothetical protein
MPYKDPSSPAALESLRRARRKHYEKNRQAYIDRSKAAQAELGRWVRSQKDKPCADCGVKYPYYVMQFDHVRGEKVADIARLIQSKSAKKVREEIEKCEVVCANCHAIRTWNRAHHAGHAQLVFGSGL